MFTGELHDLFAMMRSWDLAFRESSYGGAFAGGEAALEEETAGGGFPVDHFSAGGERGVLDETELGIEFGPADTAGR